jgi:deoxyribodipyrimidine photolyase-related protein
MDIFLIFPNQLFKALPKEILGKEVMIIEDPLFFNLYPFHKQKIAFHRASIKFYEYYLTSKKIDVKYIALKEAQSYDFVKSLNVKSITTYYPSDNWLEKKLNKLAKEQTISIHYIDNPSFKNNLNDIQSYFGGKKSVFHHDFYILQRKKWNILLTPDGKPIQGKWSFDADNRKKYPKDKTPPSIISLTKNEWDKEAENYVNTHFSIHLGELTDTKRYPTTYEESQAYLQDFLNHRFYDFGEYEDAIVKDEAILHHSLLSPLINAGLLSIEEIIRETVNFGLQYEIPLNSLEGFIRQIIGWREFIHGIYIEKGTFQRNSNFWNHQHPMPKAFYNGTTSIEPVDDAIKKLIQTGYNHHIERLMILGNFMLLCEIHPNAVYQWFMEFYIDAYDWVMVPNVYGMSQFADGGYMCTKPYISSSNYILKMSDYKKGAWCDIWDGLYWRFVTKHREFLSKNIRFKMIISQLDKMNPERKAFLFEQAENFLVKLHTPK